MSEKEKKCCGGEKENCCEHDNRHKDCKNHDHGHGKCHEKVQELETALEEKQKELDELKLKSNQVLATASYYKNEAETTKKDFERFKERNKNIEAELEQKTNETAVKKLLPIIDNFGQAMTAVDESVKKGFEMIYNSMLEMLAGFGAEEIAAEGDLDPEMHNCISTELADDENLDGKIATVYQKGYKIAKTNKVIRPSTVSVYKK